MREFELDKCVRYLTCGEVDEFRGCTRSRGRQCRENGLEAGQCAVHELSYYLHTRWCSGRSKDCLICVSFCIILFASSTAFENVQYESLIRIDISSGLLLERLHYISRQSTTLACYGIDTGRLCSRDGNGSFLRRAG